ncbi:MULTISPECIES: 16S rRNA (guanine(527)-N(7))-methyltransferase RsmG [Helicobacter]|uniref:Ribosomal RNA small subunit methyltransferase G n=1 Tax=Helicobacter ailurogastricus TaxID=1578720 RepID=A0A0K2XAW2_9HELI|nr:MULTISPECIES: 16S rRNA (guanine(527)-N(7))-methyltransferase RsmG [Helicobacter]CRF40561.1 rRNA small subunit 7-methylguanosine (m7G) methyltransferase GidB [Helicobacter ailurogastricus]CRF42703.1 rRNA small subunit 7-methylguanosine (m7G) methyltransferase GidB [Helicobacter ailurogastricus]CRF43805.1 rRNA small subunit 7-methylguanosine (m7G) methyltransferase GidB [Helicobacter ailurogastricus]CRF46084.1 rRNA small subunit 7-methylguanosine (m7G) methyltransferase GidB [Helicobacter heil
MKDKLDLFSNLLLEWNRVHNLSGAKNRQDIERNIADSLQVLDFIAPFKSCLDVGSGAGFPAIPLSLACPHARFILLEPNAKKMAFLHHLKASLDLQNVRLKRLRLQELPPLKVELITSRALMPAQELLNLSAPFLEKGGHFLFYKGSNLSTEISCLPEECFAYGKRVYFYRKGAN